MLIPSVFRAFGVWGMPLGCEDEAVLPILGGAFVGFLATTRLGGAFLGAFGLGSFLNTFGLETRRIAADDDDDFLAEPNDFLLAVVMIEDRALHASLA